jgi:hypothetical protein
MSDPFGEVVMSRRFDHETKRERFYIDQADPRARISAELLMQAMEGECEPWLHVGGEGADVLTFSDDYGQRFIYSLGQYDVLHDAFEIEWPD